MDGSTTTASFNSPRGITIDSSGAIYVADFNNNKIRKISNYYSISPSLPAGLVLNSDGSISGTPTVASPATNYVVTATNAGGSSSCTLTIEVVNKIEWTGATSTDWNTATNWSNNTVPTSSDIVVINTSTPNAPILNVAYTVGTGRTLNIGNTGTLIVAPNASLTIAGTADFGHKSVTFKSDVTGTGMLGVVTGSLLNADNVTTERYIPARRAFRLLSSSLTTTTSIKSNWQEGANNTSILYANNLNSNPTFGTHITGSITGSNGFDATQTASPSLFGFNNSIGQWTSISNTDITTLNAGTPYRLMVRGDRSINLTYNSPIPSATTLRATGTLLTGNITLSNNSLNQTANEYSLIGNPYQAPLDMKAILDASIGLNKNYYYIWDPTQNTRGAYVTIGVQTGINSINGSSGNKYLQPGQAAFIRKDATATSASLTFAEVNKYVTATNGNVFKQQEINTALIKVNLYSNDTPLDGLAIVFDANSNNEININDASKLPNMDEDIATSNNGVLSSIEYRLLPINSEEIQLYTSKYRSSNYTLKINLENYTGITPFLVDTYTQIYTELNADTETIYQFTIDANPNSTASNRFKIVFDNSILNNAHFENESYIFPNPSSDSTFNVSLNKWNSNAKISLFNTIGQKIGISIKVNENNSYECKAVNKLPTGAYLVVIENEGVKMVKKWIIK